MVIKVVSTSVSNDHLDTLVSSHKRGALMQISFIIKIHLSPWSSSSLDWQKKHCLQLISCCSFVPRCLIVLLRKFICCQTPLKVNISVYYLVTCDVWVTKRE